MKVSALIFIFFFFSIDVQGQIQPGSWLINFNFDALNNRFDLEQENLKIKEFAFNSVVNIQLGYIFKNRFFWGLGFSHRKNDRETFNIDFTELRSITVHTLNPTVHYYFGKNPSKRQTFVYTQFDLEKEKRVFNRNPNQHSEDLFYKIRGRVGMGFSYFKIPNAAMELKLSYQLLNSEFHEGNVFFDLNRGHFNLELGVQLYYNSSFKDFFKYHPIIRLEKGTQQITFSGITEIFNFSRDDYISWEVAYRYFIFNNFSVGIQNKSFLNFFDNRVNFDVEWNFNIRSYIPIASNIQLFGHMEFNSRNAGNIYGKVFDEEDNHQALEVGSVEFLTIHPGFGMNIFLDENISLEWLYTYYRELNGENKRDGIRWRSGINFFF